MRTVFSVESKLTKSRDAVIFGRTLKLFHEGLRKCLIASELTRFLSSESSKDIINAAVKLNIFVRKENRNSSFIIFHFLVATQKENFFSNTLGSRYKYYL